MVDKSIKVRIDKEHGMAQLKIKLSIADKKRIRQLAKKSEKSVKKYVLEKCLSEIQEKKVPFRLEEIETVSISLNDEELKKKKYVVSPPGLTQKKEIIYDLNVQFYQNYSWHAYLLWILNSKSEALGMTLEEYILDYLEQFKDYPHSGDLLTTFRFLKPGEKEFVYSVIRCEEIRSAREFSKFLAKIKKLVFEEIRGGEPYLGDF